MTRPRPWHAAIAGLSALLLGIGLSRFAFTPLIPALVQVGWFTAAQAGYLGATNLAGYLVGAAIARRAACHVEAMTLVKAAMIVGAASFVACAAPLGFTWCFAWRLISGIIGGVLMVLAPTAVLATTPPERRGRVAGIIFTGVGAGIALSGTAVPWLVRAGLPTTWSTLGAIGGLLTALAWGGWPRTAIVPAARQPATRLMLTPTVVLLVASYGMLGLAFASPTVYWTDFVARGLDLGLGVGGFYWMVLGVGAACGPVLTGFVAERLGFARTYALILVVFSLCIGAPAVWAGTPVLLLSSFGVGACGLATTSLGSGRAGELVPIEQHRRLWGWMTIAYAVVYAAGGYVCAFIFARTGSYAALFALGAAMALLSALLAWLSARNGRVAIPR
ncbi:MAG: YbfB/YjiJ family MFS transporter [Alphaproteobacteria bacterium]|nr:YbfB/YjiJ family MFS transporter [Alphaproteobacteria bacterium]